MAEPNRKPFDYDQVQVGEELGSYEYVLTQEMLDRYRQAVEDPEAAFATIAVKHDATAFLMVYDDQTGNVNTGNEAEFFNAPIPGKLIRVTARVADRYIRRDRPYLVLEATAVDEDGRLLEKVRTYQLKKPDEVGQKWGPPGP
jgi:hypothetical protein